MSKCGSVMSWRSPWMSARRMNHFILMASIFEVLLRPLFFAIRIGILYVAEAKEPVDALEQFAFTPYIGRVFRQEAPHDFVFCWDASGTSLAIIALDLDHPILFGQPPYHLCTGYEYTHDGRLLGLRWCYNRPSGIWEITLHDGLPTSLHCTSKKLTPAHLSCRSPSIHYDADRKIGRLFWLSCASSGPHGGTFSLHEFTTQALVDTIWEPRASDGFPGLYINANLPASPFVTLDGKLFLFSTLHSDRKLYSWSVLATDGCERVVCSRSAPSIPPEIVLGSINAAGEISWRVIHSPYISPLCTYLYTSSVVDLTPHLRSANSPLQPQLFRDCHPEPRTNADIGHPAIEHRNDASLHSAIHGGPHGAIMTAFSPSIAALALEGCIGSTGYGEAFVRALLGNCETLDVQDCLATVRHLVSLGLAHGGFLTAHLIGQFPYMFTAAVIRNPVTSTDPMSSDIPDWFFNEWSIEIPGHADSTPHALPPRRTPAESQRLWVTAPLAHVDAVTAHVLLHLGGADLRVPSHHGWEYYHALKGNARNRGPEQDIAMQWYEREGHALDGVEAARVVWETSRDWFGRYWA
ncbi:Alpha/Beta hydrolase protein [Mycena rosella]|uniref:Dipeptidyl-peptidase V n=1 Tax=Mycena rosella TaxID=1033263 RepID=A0AAD7D8P7_MYCRO|nr:Alpha/Beta hydrolase protein [Mycena rosella]